VRLSSAVDGGIFFDKKANLSFLRLRRRNGLADRMEYNPQLKVHSIRPNRLTAPPFKP